jgi:hypothetical protein
MTPHYKRFLEGHGQALRRVCNVSHFGRLDPFELAKKMKMQVLKLDSQCGVPQELCDRLLGSDSKHWSAGTLHLPNGEILVVMNPTHEIQRQHASLMEEVSHIHLKHKPTQLVHVNGLVLRSWDKSKEDQAYWVGAAALLPERVLKGARTLGKTIQDVAEEHAISVPLVKFRMQILGIQLSSSEN